jgi:hypothetical protein
VYLNDGITAQCKKRKDHQHLPCAEWHFFATGHGVGPADGMGETVKRLAAETSVQTVYKNQIGTPHKLFNYCSSNIHIIFFFIQEEQILNRKKELAE